MSGGAGSGRRNLAFVGDVHLDEDEASLREFLAFLERLSQSCARIVLLGDLFNLWIGHRAFEQPQHAAVAAKLAELRRGGVVVRYVEGNRDYRIGDAYAGSALDDATDAGVVEDFGGHRVFAVHGDLVNLDDRRYRVWRRLSRSGPAWRAFDWAPQALQVRAAVTLERVLRGTNPGFKREFPEAHVRAYVARLVHAGYDLVVLGHFHVERDLQCEVGGRHGRALVLPLWRESRRHLELTPDGGIAFVDSLA